MNTNTFSIVDEAAKRLSLNLYSKFDELAIEGLKRKGFEFESHLEYEEFIKLRCSCEDNILKKERIYSIDQIPFFLHSYKTQIDLPEWNENGCYISATLGSYSFL